MYEEADLEKVKNVNVLMSELCLAWRRCKQIPITVRLVRDFEILDTVSGTNSYLALCRPGVSKKLHVVWYLVERPNPYRPRPGLYSDALRNWKSTAQCAEILSKLRAHSNGVGLSRGELNTIRHNVTKEILRLRSVVCECGCNKASDKEVAKAMHHTRDV